MERQGAWTCEALITNCLKTYESHWSRYRGVLRFLLCCQSVCGVSSCRALDYSFVSIIGHWGVTDCRICIVLAVEWSGVVFSNLMTSGYEWEGPHLLVLVRTIFGYKFMEFELKPPWNWLWCALSLYILVLSIAYFNGKNNNFWGLPGILISPVLFFVVVAECMYKVDRRVIVCHALSLTEAIKPNVSI